MARKPGDSRPDNAPEKLAMPDEASVLDYINSCAVPPSLRDITRAFKIGQDQRASMRRMLRDMAERGILAGDRRGIAAPDTLPVANAQTTSLISFKPFSMRARVSSSYRVSSNSACSSASK